MGEFFLTDIDGLATVTTPAPTTAPETTDKTAETYECPAGSTVVEVDFNEFSSGQYVDQLTSSLKVTAAGHKEKGYTPGGKARIFDSNNPTGGDKDLGSPNYSCDGPGVGKGGRKGRPGENCNDLGKLLIIQESNKVDPDDLASGGKFTFSTDADKEMTFLRMGVLDIDETDVTLAVDSPVKFAGVGDNGFQDLVNPNPKLFANSFEVSMPGSGAVAYLVSFLSNVISLWSMM